MCVSWGGSVWVCVLALYAAYADCYHMLTVHSDRDTEGDAKLVRGIHSILKSCDPSFSTLVNRDISQLH